MPGPPPVPVGYDPNATYPAPGSAAASGAPAPGSTATTGSPGDQTNLSTTAIKEASLIIPGSEGQGPTPGSPAQFNMAENNTGLPTSSSPLTLGVMMDNLLALSPTDTETLQQQLIKGGFVDPKSQSFEIGNVNPGDATYNGYLHLLETAYRTQTDFQSVLDDRASAMVGKTNYLAFEQKLTALTTGVKSTSTTTMLTDPATAQGVLIGALQQQLHRAPTTSEIAQFTSMLQQTEVNNPEVATSTTDPATGLPTRTSLRTGVDSYRFPEEAALDYATSGKLGQEANTQRVGIDYQNAMTELLQGQPESAIHGGA
jgi:hypothetical protein